MTSADLRDELTCSICLNIYTDPIIVACGHSFCRSCIGNVLDTQGPKRYSCPLCRKNFRKKPKLKRNLSLSNITESFQSAHRAGKRVGIPCTYCIHSPVPAVKTCLHCEASLCDKHLQKHSKSAEHIFIEPTTSLENRKCSVHKEILKYYCCEDAACICVSCRLDGKHRGHQVETLNEASEKEKEEQKNTLQELTSKREETENRVRSLQELKGQVQRKAARVTEAVTALIREQLKALEERVLSEISRQKEQVSLRVSELIQQLEKKKEDLSRKMGDIEELCNMTDPLTVLQGRESDRADYCDAEEGDNEDTERHDRKVQDVGDLDVGLILLALHSGLTGILTGITRRHRVPEASDMFLDVNTASDMFLDVNTAGNRVSVSDDLKTVSWSLIKQNRPETPERFELPQVLSSQSFSSGRHYWEVEVSESGRWEVGMAYPSIDRRGGQSRIGNNYKSLGLGNRVNEEYYVIHDIKSILLPHRSSCRRFRIFLDYEAGHLSFHELCDPIRHLHTFTAAFTEPLHAVFRVYGGNSWVRI